jgi:hypothetical protein
VPELDSVVIEFVKSVAALDGFAWWDVFEAPEQRIGAYAGWVAVKGEGWANAVSAAYNAAGLAAIQVLSRVLIHRYESLKASGDVGMAREWVAIISAFAGPMPSQGGSGRLFHAVGCLATRQYLSADQLRVAYLPFADAIPMRS